mmetsp:Transcript_28237/g.63702  ORF Transcript_28237/g.63702 Transcript_28237/m.63702 type:complete len:93 (-) Transcript_28237:3-281(-)
MSSPVQAKVSEPLTVRDRINNSGAVPNSKRHLFGRGMVRRENQITLIFAISLICDYYGFATSESVDGVFDICGANRPRHDYDPIQVPLYTSA